MVPKLSSRAAGIFDGLASASKNIVGANEVHAQIATARTAYQFGNRGIAKAYLSDAWSRLDTLRDRPATSESARRLQRAISRAMLALRLAKAVWPRDRARFRGDV